MKITKLPTTHTKTSSRLTASRLTARSLTIALGLSLMTTASVAATAPTAFSLPSMTAGANFYDTYRNEQIAAWSLRQIYDDLPLVEDPWANQVLVQLSAELNAKVRTQQLYATPLIVDNSMNAFAVPGGLIGMNTGTILAAQGLDEVASVLAHEIAHISQRHYESRMENNKKLMALQLGGLIAAIAASAAGGDAALLAMAGGQTATAESAATHSRENEKEADRVGMQILVQSGYDAHAMPRFFSRLQRQLNINQAKNAFMPSFMQSHPFTAERMSEASARAASYAKPVMTAKHEQAKLFDRWSWRIKYLTKQATYAELVANAPQSEGARLALASWLADAQRHREATQVLEVGRFDAADVLVCITKSHLVFAQKQYDQAIEMIKPCQAIYPERRDLRLILAKYHIHAGDGQAANALLSPLTFDGSHDLSAWQLSAQAYELMARTATSDHATTIATINALRARSQVELWRGQYQGALQSLAQADELAAGSDRTKLMRAMLAKDKDAVISARDFRP
ncbi:M48 family metalloprotease [Moraxella sp. FZLJ2107]|uniref:M48 family metalloprotease n=1 Tax=unclassified Moraxella TaxID=2685852 RepID=UPI0020C84401|nr:MULTISPECIES: M48 family metalloprotease [unclassified Moraxella]UTO06028.1 M48 family metalloprotease [Moraxella sp. FZLJ2107]UTO22765.1 M48 family metalloprotease [Moraxella sp. FZLJ2109]